MLISYELNPKHTLSPTKLTAYPPYQQNGPQEFFRNTNTGTNYPKKNFNNEPTLGHKKSAYLAPISSAKEYINPDSISRASIKSNSLSPIREQNTTIQNISRVSQRYGSDRLSKLMPEITESIYEDRLQRTTISPQKKEAKKPKLFNEKHLDSSPLPDPRKKKINLSQIKEFGEKYNLKFVPGYSSKALERYINLLSGENDPLLLENLFPGNYTLYTTLSSSINLPTIESSNNLNISRFDTLNISSSPGNDPNKFLPEIRTRRSQNSVPFVLGSESPTDRDQISRSTAQSRFSSMSSMFGSKKLKSFPPMDMDTFQESLHFYKDFMNKSVLLLIEANYAGASLELGFCELLWDESKPSYTHIAKFYVQRVYRKMSLMIPIMVKVVDYLFRIYKQDKISMNLLPGNEALSGPLATLGFVYDKIFHQNDTKWHQYVLKKKSFYEVFQEGLGVSSDSNITSSTVKGLTKSQITK